MSKYPEQPPPYGFQGQQPQPAPMMVTPNVATVTSVIVTAQLGPQSQMMTCPSCHHQISTRVQQEAVTKTHMMALLLCLLGCWPCVCIPYCTDSCQSTNHYCPSCNAFLGSYNQ